MTMLRGGLIQVGLKAPTDKDPETIRKAMIDADGSYLGKYRKTHIPQVAGFYPRKGAIIKRPAFPSSFAALEKRRKLAGATVP